MDNEATGVFDRPAGSYILKDDGTLEPNMNDEAMQNRLKKPQGETEEADNDVSQK